MSRHGCSKYVAHAFDVYSILVSVADVVTDVLVMQQYYDNGAMVFFWIGVTNLIVAQLCYCFVFMIRYGKDNCGHRILTFVLALPFAPLLSFVFYWASLPNNVLSRWFRKIGLTPHEYSTNKVQKKTKQRRRRRGGGGGGGGKEEEEEEGQELSAWLEERLYKNMGFILEAMVEAFPQSLLQMCALVYTSRVNWVTLSSIMLSLISFATKSVVFSESLDVSVFLYNWLSLICDFVGIFVVISWVFITPKGAILDSEIGHVNLSWLGHFTLLGELWFIKVLVCSIPFIVCCGIPLTIVIVNEFYRQVPQQERDLWKCHTKTLVISCYTLFGFFLFCCGSAIALFIIEIPFFGLIAFCLYLFNQTRYRFFFFFLKKFPPPPFFFFFFFFGH
ncbi:hypothetical protein RFI_16459 [Reticulomyxa filosa]|uniref:Transmembrane protein n=1 Tax=Reticulomyxa filosa TaxID=46433 RepID=X6N399_RETFI|nr:hypothetical protein RFI_16459 [Reticulomyxa filosa]|eukprot:ETO20755.1 hypothetical protein RFI_16459 [Reticulomyxa filosa]